MTDVDTRLPVALRLLLAGDPAETTVDPDRYNRDHQEIFGSAGKATRLDDGTVRLRCPDATILVKVMPAGPVTAVPQYTACQPEFYHDDPQASSDERLDEAGLAAACAGVRSAVVLSTTLPDDDLWERAPFLKDLADAAEVLLSQLDVSVVLPGAAYRQLTPARFAALNRHTNENEFNSFPIWCGVEHHDGYLTTYGLRWYALPELERPLDPDADLAAAARELAALGLASFRHGRPRIGVHIGTGRARTHQLTAGRPGLNSLMVTPLNVASTQTN